MSFDVEEGFATPIQFRKFGNQFPKNCESDHSDADVEGMLRNWRRP